MEKGLLVVQACIRTGSLDEVAVDYDQKIVTFLLSQEDIRKLDGRDCYAQVRFKTQSGVSYVTAIKSIRI